MGRVDHDQYVRQVLSDEKGLSTVLFNGKPASVLVNFGPYIVACRLGSNSKKPKFVVGKITPQGKIDKDAERSYLGDIRLAYFSLWGMGGDAGLHRHGLAPTYHAESLYPDIIEGAIGVLPRHGSMLPSRRKSITGAGSRLCGEKSSWPSRLGATKSPTKCN